MIEKKNIDVLGIGNAVIDVIADADDNFLLEYGLNKGSMTLVDEIVSEKIYFSMKKKIANIGRFSSKYNIWFVSIKLQRCFYWYEI